MVLGSYYLTILRPNAQGEGKVFTGINEAILAHQHKNLQLQALIQVRMEGYGLVKTTLGRMIFNEILPPEIRDFYQVTKVSLEADTPEAREALIKGLKGKRWLNQSLIAKVKKSFQLIQLLMLVILKTYLLVMLKKLLFMVVTLDNGISVTKQVKRTW